MIVFEGYAQAEKTPEKAPSLWEQISKLPLELKLGKYEIKTGAGRVRVEAGKKPEVAPAPVPVAPSPRRAGFDFGNMLPILGIGAAIAVVLFLVTRK
jgi:hypothetical protein